MSIDSGFDIKLIYAYSAKLYYISNKMIWCTMKYEIIGKEYTEMFAIFDGYYNVSGEKRVVYLRDIKKLDDGQFIQKLLPIHKMNHDLIYRWQEGNIITFRAALIENCIKRIYYPHGFELISKEL